MNSCFRPSSVRLALSGALLASVLALSLSFDRSGRTAVPAACCGLVLQTNGDPVSRAGTNSEFRATSASPTFVLRSHRVSAAQPLEAVLPELTQPVSDWREFAPEHLTVEPVRGLALDFVVTSVERDAHSTTWIGRTDIPGAALVGIGTRAGWDAILTLPGANAYALHVRDGRATVTETNPADETCGRKDVVPVRADLNAASNAPQTVEPPPPPTSVNLVDVAFFYDETTLAAASARALDADGATLLDSTYKAQITLANLALVNSGVTNLQWRFVGSDLVPAFARTGRLADDLAMMATATGDAGRFIAARSDELVADQAVLVVDGAADWAGLAPIGGRQAVVTWGSGYETTAHELAHNFGCFHDRQTEGAADGDGLYAYGYRFAAGGFDCGDLMSYAGFRLPYFSNPEITVVLNQHLLGANLGSMALGVADDQPRAADAARVLRENAAAVAATRAATVGR
jgi:hypothetical protein